MKSPWKRALKMFPVGTKVAVTPLAGPEWDSGFPCDIVVCGHVQYRDSEDYPRICVCLVSVSGCIAGWFLPEELTRIR